MPIRRRTLIALSLAVICLVILGNLELEAEGTTSFVRGNPAQQIELKFAPRRLDEIAAALVLGVRNAGGTYRVVDESGVNREIGKFRLLLDDSGFVSGYAMISSEGQRRVWKHVFGYYLADDTGNSWEPTTASPTRMYQGLVGDIVRLF
jgi:hypothetical protein